MTTIKTKDLTGRSLDWAVAVADGQARHDAYDCWVIEIDQADGTQSCEDYSPSTSWTHGGPLIDEYAIEFVSQGGGMIGAYAEFCYSPDQEPCGTGHTHLVAACRAIVAAELGEEVDVPGELL